MGNVWALGVETTQTPSQLHSSCLGLRVLFSNSCVTRDPVLTRQWLPAVVSSQAIWTRCTRTSQICIRSWGAALEKEARGKKSRQQTPRHPSARALRASCSTSNVAVRCCAVHAVLAPGDAAEPGFKDPSVNRGNLQGRGIFITLWLSPPRVHIADSLQPCS